MENLLDGEDFSIVAEGLKETSGLTDQVFQIKRASGFTGGTYNGKAPTPTYKYFNFMGTQEYVTAQEAVTSGGMLSLGDLKITSTLPVSEKLEGGDGYSIQQGDVLVYQQREYYMVGIPNLETFAGDTPFTTVMWRRT